MNPSLSALRAHARHWALGSPYDPELELERCASSGVAVLAPDGESYPEMLGTIPDPPRVLYCRGRLPLQGRGVALVGSRRPTLYGRRMARRFAQQCAQQGIPVVSGLARGVDTEAHRAALEAGGSTWAVLGSGLDRVYPPENQGLAEAIVAQGGTLLTEVPMGGPPAAENFPRRNRIISGLSWATVVVEGDLRSGSLITARAALEQGREVFAVPGPADSPLSAGPLHLIRQGAKPACSLADVIEELPMLPARDGSPVPRPLGEEKSALTQDEEKVLELLGAHCLSLEELAAGTGWAAPRLLRAISALEAENILSSLPGQRYARV